MSIKNTSRKNIKSMNRNYCIKTAKVKKQVMIYLITDLHYQEPKDLEKYQFITEEIKKDKPDFLVIGGDLLDQAIVEEENAMINQIKEWAKETITLICIGNHDLVLHKKQTIYHNNELFWQKLKEIQNVYVLDNENYETEELRFIGLTLPHSYYYHYKENPNYLMRYLNRSHKTVYENNKLNIILSHSSLGFLNQNGKTPIYMLENIDIILSGHTHNGMVPQKLEKIMKNRGFISPFKDLFPKKIRGAFDEKNIHFIMSGGVTKLSKKSGLSMFDQFWNHELTKIIIKPEDSNNNF